MAQVKSLLVGTSKVNERMVVDHCCIYNTFIPYLQGTQATLHWQETATTKNYSAWILKQRTHAILKHNQQRSAYT